MARKEGIYFYRDWIAPFEMLSDSERGRLVLAMMKYAMEGEQPPQFEGSAKMAAMFLFPQLDRSMICRENGKKGAEVTNAAHKAAPPCEPKKEEREEIAEKKEIREREVERERDREDRFEEFWGEYPKKTGKAEARQNFSKIAPDDRLFQRMMDAVKAQKRTRQWQSEGGRFIPAPALWLSRGQWEDEVCEAPPEREKKGSFDTDDFFNDALRRSCGDELYEQLYGSG